MNKQFLCVKQPTVGSCACVSEDGIAPNECDYCHYNPKATFPPEEYSSAAPIQKPNHFEGQTDPLESDEKAPVMTIREERQKAHTDDYMKYQNKGKKAPACNRITCNCE